MSKKMYLVMAMTESAPSVNGGEVNMSWADGMIGAIPVFTNKAKAKKYACGAQIIEIGEKK